MYDDGPWRSCQFDGESYGIRNTSNCLALFYDKDMLEAAGVDTPGTWDELREAASELREGNRFGLAVSAINAEEGTFHFLPFLWQAGADIDSLDASLGPATWQQDPRNLIPYLKRTDRQPSRRDLADVPSWAEDPS